MERQFAATAAKDLELTSAAVELQLAKLTAKLREFKAKGEARSSSCCRRCPCTRCSRRRLRRAACER